MRTAARKDRSEEGTLTEVAYRRLRRDIISGALAPGAPLRLEALRARYDVSFSPLREALNRLQSERLTVATALRGFSVAPISVSEMWDAVQVRILIETDALARAIAKGGDDWEAAIVAAFHALNLQSARLNGTAPHFDPDAVEAMEVRHFEFHMALLGACGSPRLLELARQFQAETQRYRQPTLIPALFGQSGAPARDVVAEHEAIMSATLGRRSDLAAALLADHYRRTATLVEAGLTRQS
jgi:GntR family transcriptional regulator, carbon starvation induced regulator